MKPPNMGGLLKMFDTSGVQPLQVQRFLGFTVDEFTGRRESGGYAAAVDLTGPYSMRSVAGDQTVDLEEFGDRYRDPRWLWSGEVLNTRRDDDAPGGVSQGDRIVSPSGEVFEILMRQYDQPVTDFSGYLIARFET